MNSVIIFIALIMASQQAALTPNKDSEVPPGIVIKTAVAEDSLVAFEYEMCPGDLKMDITGVCREVFYDDWNDD